MCETVYWGGSEYTESVGGLVEHQKLQSLLPKIH